MTVLWPGPKPRGGAELQSVMGELDRGTEWTEEPAQELWASGFSSEEEGREYVNEWGLHSSSTIPERNDTEFSSSENFRIQDLMIRNTGFENQDWFLEEDTSFHERERSDFEAIVNSSYPLLRENFFLLEKLKKERDFCRKLESDMRNLEDHIQDVTKSFDQDIEGEMDMRDTENDEDCEEQSPESPKLSNSYDQFYESEDPEGDEEATDPMGEGNPLLLVENMFARLFLLGEELERRLKRECDSIRGSDEAIQIQSDWERLEEWRQLTGLARELRRSLLHFRTILGRVLQPRDWSHEECSSQASFTFQEFKNSQVIVPTVRAIFTQVGDSIELRRISSEEDESSERGESWTVEGSELSGDEELEAAGEAPPPSDLRPPSPARSSPQEDVLSAQHSEEELSSATPQEVARPSAAGTSQYSHSSEIIKRIERLQELVKPELRESLTLRALRIARAKEDFLNGPLPELPTVGGPATPPPPPLSLEAAQILVEELSVPAGLSVKDQVEEPRRDEGVEETEAERKATSGEERKLQKPHTTESQLLSAKTDWLRNPFRPKGKYKINK